MLDLSGNDLTGTLPPSFSTLTGLKVSLISVVPANMAACDSGGVGRAVVSEPCVHEMDPLLLLMLLQQLKLDGNRLTGPVPDSWSTLQFIVSGLFLPKDGCRLHMCTCVGAVGSCPS